MLREEHSKSIFSENHLLQSAVETYPLTKKLQSYHHYSPNQGDNNSRNLIMLDETSKSRLSTIMEEEFLVNDNSFTGFPASPKFKGFALQDEQYYFECRNSSCNTLNVIMIGRNKLEYNDFRSLWQNNWTAWLTASLVEFSLNTLCYFNHKQASIVYCAYAYGAVLFGFSKPEHLEGVQYILSTYCTESLIIIPIHHRSHFTVAIFDFCRNEFYFFDPLLQYNTSEMFHRLIETVNNTLKCYKQDEFLTQLAEKIGR